MFYRRSIAAVLALLVSLPAGADDDLLLTLPTLFANVPARPACAAKPPAEGPAAGDYRAFAFTAPSDVLALAVSQRGWRTAAATEGAGLYVFGRDQQTPLVHALDGHRLEDLAMSRDGSALVTADNDGVLYYFECDGAVPAWHYDARQDDADSYDFAPRVAISGDGRWLAATAGQHLYLFRRDRQDPVLKLALGDGSLRLTSLALSRDGSRLATATEFGYANQGQRASTLYFLDRRGLRWQTQVTAQDAECTANEAFLPLAIDGSGAHLAAAGCDDAVRFWDTGSATPAWRAEVGDGAMLTSLALADDGGSLAVTGDTLHYVRDTSVPPGFDSGDNWALDYWLDYDQPAVYGSLDSWAQPWDGSIGREPRGGLQNLGISHDGRYLYAGATDLSYLLHRDYSAPIRLFGATQEIGQYFSAVAMSPDASWVAAGSVFGGEILRFEVAPVQKISIDVPVAGTLTVFDDVDIFGLFGADKFEVDYRVLKPGRATRVTQHWTLYGYDGTVFVSPITDLLCSGDAEWSWELDLPDGAVEATGTREIDPPQCLASAVSSIGSYVLFADLEEQDPAPGAVSELFTDSTVLMRVQVGTGP
jgi:hypothetical protein